MKYLLDVSAFVVNMRYVTQFVRYEDVLSNTSEI